MNAMRRIRSAAFLLAAALPVLGAVPAGAQQTRGQRPGPQPASQPPADPVTGSYRWRQVGPANMSGRISDLDVPPGGEASTIFVAASAGGIWKTVNNGCTWEQVFQGGKTAAVGDIAFAPSNPDIIYAGMGEPHSRNSISWGDGVWKSVNGGETWTHVGLEYTYHIGRIAVDPRDPQIVYVAALGNLWDLNRGDRGLYKSEDGGRTWNKLKGFDDGTGFYDVVIDPSNPDVVWATSWKRDRKPWVFLSGGGPNNGLWKSIDAGLTWQRIEGNGLPPSEENGKISLELFPGDTDIIYARIESFAEEAPAEPPAAETERPAGQAAARQRGGRNLGGTYMSRDGGASWRRIDRRNGRPFYYCQLRIDPNDADTVYLIDSSLYKLDVPAAMAALDDPQAGRETPGVENITGNHHVDFHAMWIDPTNSDHLVVGSDGGVSISWDGGGTWDFLDNLVVGQFYAVCYDMAEPYNIYGGLQDNGTWGGPSNSLSSSGILLRDWTFFLGGDGFHAQADPADPDLVIYGESQGGNLTRTNRTTGESRGIRPNLPQPPREDLSEQQRQFMARGGGGGRSNIVNPPEGLGPRDLRFNWSSPVVLSPHNPRTVYFGAQFLFKSVDRGDTWQIISPDLTTNDEEKYGAQNRGDSSTGAEKHCTIITIGESPLIPGLIWVGTDDGRLHVTRNGGATWTSVRENVGGVPRNTWVSRVRPSAFAAERCYVTFDNHRMGDMTTYVYVTEDFGQTWLKLGGDLPTDDPAYVITEDPVNENLLYVGTESGIYVSLDRGGSWRRFNNNLPVVPVHDVVVHPREHDLIIATHGLSLWIMDDVTGLQGLTPEAMASAFTLLPHRTATAWNMQGEQVSRGDKVFAGENPPDGFTVSYWIGTPVESVKITLTGVDGEEYRSIDAPGEEGLQTVRIPLRPSFGRGMARPQPGEPMARPLGPGIYLLTVTCGAETATATVEVRPDPRSTGR